MLVRNSNRTCLPAVHVRFDELVYRLSWFRVKDDDCRSIDWFRRQSFAGTNGRFAESARNEYRPEVPDNRAVEKDDRSDCGADRSTWSSSLEDDYNIRCWRSRWARQTPLLIRAPGASMGACPRRCSRKCRRTMADDARPMTHLTAILPSDRSRGDGDEFATTTTTTTTTTGNVTIAPMYPWRRSPHPRRPPRRPCRRYPRRRTSLGKNGPNAGRRLPTVTWSLRVSVLSHGWEAPRDFRLGRAVFRQVPMFSNAMSRAVTYSRGFFSGDWECLDDDIGETFSVNRKIIVCIKNTSLII